VRTFALSKSTTNSYVDALYGLLVFLSDNGVRIVAGISEVYLLAFMKSLPPETLSVNHSKTGVIKGFLTYLYDEKITVKDYSQVIMRTNCKQQPRLPLFFTPEEVATIINKIDRASPSGKRDYAMTLFAVKLGLRVSDIAFLKFENINWDKGLVAFTQFKTGKEIVLPLLPEIGNAIVDYLKYGRPVCDTPYCFDQHIYPYKPISPQDVTSKIHMCIRRSGVSLNDRRKGAHALRHSFATQLLENKTPLPVISEALGHRHTASTMLYLRVDKGQLKGRRGCQMKKLRQSTVEPVFGSLIKYYGLSKIGVLGKAGAQKGMLMATIAFNFKKYLKTGGKKLSCRTLYKTSNRFYLRYSPF